MQRESTKKRFIPPTPDERNNNRFSPYRHSLVVIYINDQKNYVLSLDIILHQRTATAARRHEHIFANRFLKKLECNVGRGNFNPSFFPCSARLLISIYINLVILHRFSKTKKNVSMECSIATTFKNPRKMQWKITASNLKIKDKCTTLISLPKNIYL